jgi:ribokinase
MSNIQVVGLGALNMDYLYKVERILGDGETVIKESTLSPGGSAANTIYGLAGLGVRTGFVGIVGDDADGKALINDFQKIGVDTSQIKIKPKTKTGAVLCLSDSLGKRSLYVSPGANSLLTIDDLDLDYINQAEILHISSFADDKQFKVSLELMDKLNPSVKVSFSPGSIYATKGLRALAPILSKTYVLFLNQSELKQLTGKDITAGTETCLKQGCQIIAVTLGEGTKIGNITATSYIRDADSEYIIESRMSPEVQEVMDRLTGRTIVDTTGAGDAFATGFLYGLINRKPLDECGRLGDIVARFSIQKIGAREGLPSLAELSQLYQETYKKD